MITKEIFQHLIKIAATDYEPINHQDFMPIRDKISLADASNYCLKDEDGKEFWKFLDDMVSKGIIKNIRYVMGELMLDDLDELPEESMDYTDDESEDDIQSQAEEELFEMNENAYLKCVLFDTELSEEEVENQIIEHLNEEFGASCYFSSEEFSQPAWCICWD